MEYLSGSWAGPSPAAGVARCVASSKSSGGALSGAVADGTVCSPADILPPAGELVDVGCAVAAGFVGGLAAGLGYDNIFG